MFLFNRLQYLWVGRGRGRIWQTFASSVPFLFFPPSFKNRALALGVFRCFDCVAVCKACFCRGGGSVERNPPKRTLHRARCSVCAFLRRGFGSNHIVTDVHFSLSSPPRPPVPPSLSLSLPPQTNRTPTGSLNKIKITQVRHRNFHQKKKSELQIFNVAYILINRNGIMIGWRHTKPSHVCITAYICRFDWVFYFIFIFSSALVKPLQNHSFCCQ